MNLPLPASKLFHFVPAEGLPPHPQALSSSIPIAPLRLHLPLFSWSCEGKLSLLLNPVTLAVSSTLSVPGPTLQGFSGPSTPMDVIPAGSHSLRTSYEPHLIAHHAANGHNKKDTLSL